nr:reverse transcriptase [Tanacetum cinerariifolium]
MKSRYGHVLTTPRPVSNVLNKPVVGYQGTSGTNVVMPNTSSKNGAIPLRKTLTQKELEEKRANHMCFYCDEKYFPGHKCSGQLHSLEVVIERTEDAGEEVFEECTTEHPPNQKDAIELMVKGLLDLRVIRPSQSPFSSPIVMKELIVETNACDTRFRAILQWEGHPIAYLSKALSPKHQAYSTYEKEFLALTLALDKWRGYLMERHFKIKTDHFSLKSFLDHRVTTPFQAKWLPKLLGFNYEISYKKRSENVAVDALSRVPNNGEVSQMFSLIAIIVSSSLWELIKDSWEQDQTLKELIEKLKGQTNISTKYTYRWSFWYTSNYPNTQFLVLLEGDEKDDQIIGQRMDKVFLSQFWKSLFKVLKVQLKMFTAYHPQTNGQSKVVNKCLECYLRCMTGEKPNEWMQWLSLAKFWYNTNFHTSINITPFKAVYGQNPPIHLPYLARESIVEAVDTRKVSYKLQLLSHSLIHPVFHASQLKECKGDVSNMGTLHVCDNNRQLSIVPIYILEIRLGDVNNKPEVFVLVQWSNRDKEEATWERFDNLMARFPQFDAGNANIT